MAPLPPSAFRQRHRCIATTSQSLGHKRCRNPAIIGGFVCRFHGGATPQAKRAADERVKELTELAAGRLHRLINSDDERIALRACVLVLRQAESTNVFAAPAESAGTDAVSIQPIDDLLASVRGGVSASYSEATERYSVG